MEKDIMNNSMENLERALGRSLLNIVVPALIDVVTSGAATAAREAAEAEESTPRRPRAKRHAKRTAKRTARPAKKQAKRAAAKRPAKRRARAAKAAGNGEAAQESGQPKLQDRLLPLVSQVGVTVPDLVRATAAPASSIRQALAKLEKAGRVQRTARGVYALVEGEVTATAVDAAASADAE